MTHLEQSVLALNELTKRGIKLAIDDFGTGYSSLSYLQRFPLSKLKIDRAFVATLSDETRESSIVSAIISMCKKLKLTVVAEGVETLSQVELLQSDDCDIAQGFYYSKPISAEDFENLYLSI